MVNLNSRIAIRVTDGVSTMWCAYIFAALAIYGFPYHDIHPNTVIQWFSQEFLQLVLLSIIMVGQKEQSKRVDNLHAKVDLHHEIVMGKVNGNSGT